MTPRSSPGGAASLSVMDTGPELIVLEAGTSARRTPLKSWTRCDRLDRHRAEDPPLQRRFAEFLGARSAIGTNSASTGLHVALDRLGFSGRRSHYEPDDVGGTANVIKHREGDAGIARRAPRRGNLDPAGRRGQPRG